MRSLSLSADGIVPCSSSEPILSAIALPMPGNDSALPWRAISATEAPESRMFFAAVRYATTR